MRKMLEEKPVFILHWTSIDFLIEITPEWSMSADVVVQQVPTLLLVVSICELHRNTQPFANLQGNLRLADGVGEICSFSMRFAALVRLHPDRRMRQGLQ
jgi:hypothetical protein